MDRHELARRIADSLPTTQHKLTRDKIESKGRYINIRKSNSFILFDIERHPGAGDSQLGEPYATLQTWKYQVQTSTLEMVCEFARWHVDLLDQNDMGEPVCRHCGTVLDLYEEVFDCTWRCGDCGAVGGKETKILNPTHGESMIDEAAFEKAGPGLWVPVGTNGNCNGDA